MTEPDINHYVQVIGYDSNGNYIIKNSWGIYWGDNGYATIEYGCSYTKQQCLIFSFSIHRPITIQILSPTHGISPSYTLLHW